MTQRREALERYYTNPKICKECEQPIKVKEGQKIREVRKKCFCDRSCAAKYNNRAHPKREPVNGKHTLFTTKEPRKVRCECGNEFLVKGKSKRLCPECRNLDKVGSLLKGEIFQRRKNWQSARSAIQKHARMTYIRSGNPLSCKVCGYSKHIEVAHIVPVSSFGDEAKVCEINHPDNLMALCPNHHWEHDH